MSYYCRSDSITNCYSLLFIRDVDRNWRTSNCDYDFSICRWIVTVVIILSSNWDTVNTNFGRSSWEGMSWLIISNSIWEIAWILTSSRIWSRIVVSSLNTNCSTVRSLNFNRVHRRKYLNFSFSTLNLDWFFLNLNLDSTSSFLVTTS